jgi:hypothetical protein
MHTPSIRFDDLVPGTPLGPLRVTVSAAANERYWRTAGADHPALRAGTLYPPIAANLTVLTFGQHCAEAMIQTRQRLVCHGTAAAGTDLVVIGEISARYQKRGRDYIDVNATIMTADDDTPLWTSEVTFTPAARLEAAP